MHPKVAGWKRKLIDEMIEYYFNFVYLAFFLVAFAWYRRLVLAEYAVLYSNYWMPLVEAAVLAKVIMLGDLLPIGHLLDRRPLIVPTIFRSMLFSGYVTVFSILERTVDAVFHGRGMKAGVADFLSKGTNEILAEYVIILCAFVPFFAYKELERVIGQDELLALFWRRGVVAARAKDRPERP